jgi:predicted RNA polymerase sigma factor
VSATDPHQVFHRTIEAVWRIESALVIAGLTRLSRDLDLAEDLAQEALVAALEQWPQSGVPDNPAAWLTATAKRRAIDLLRRNAVAERKHEELRMRLRAIFAAPALAPVEASVLHVFSGTWQSPVA